MRFAVLVVWPVLIFTCAAEDSLLSSLVRKTRQSECTRDEFTCSNGQCIGSYQICDGAKDCHDGTDETQAVCSKVGLTCPPFAFRCAYGACVDKSSTCNGRQDCADNSDELLPECLTNVKKPARSSKCKKNEFACYSGQCINEFSVCDGVRDCRDGTDETITQCVNIRCPSFSFQCAYGACIDLEKKCNGVKDCSDGSDEDEELCEYSTNVVSGNVPVVRPTIRTTTTARPTRRPTTRPSGGCLLPEKTEGTSFKVEGCASDDRSDKCQGIPGTWVPDLAVVTYSCDQGYALPLNNNIFCLNGNWRPQLLNCQKMCKPLFSESVNLVCSFGGQTVPCDLPARPGTKLRPKCKPSYHIVDPSTAYKETECREDGFWDQPVFKCVAGNDNPTQNSSLPYVVHVHKYYFILPVEIIRSFFNMTEPDENATKI